MSEMWRKSRHPLSKSCCILAFFFYKVRTQKEERKERKKMNDAVYYSLWLSCIATFITVMRIDHEKHPRLHFWAFYSWCIYTLICLGWLNALWDIATNPNLYDGDPVPIWDRILGLFAFGVLFPVGLIFWLKIKDILAPILFNFLDRK